MLKIKIHIKENKLQIKIEGHAGAAEKGKDIVCASASMLAYTLGQHITDLNKQGAFERRPVIRLEPGNAEVTCIPKKEYFNDALWGYHIIQKGFCLLAHNYPQYVETEQSVSQQQL